MSVVTSYREIASIFKGRCFFTQMKMGTQFNNKNCCNNFGNEHKLFESTVNEVNITMFNDSQIRVGVEYV